MLAPSIDSIIRWRGVTIPRWKMPEPYFVYLIHFKTPYKHAKNYCGVTHDLDARLHQHRTGNGARLMEVVTDAGIEWELARLWPCDSWEEARALERKLKKQHRPLLCPCCNPHREKDILVQMRQGHWPFALFELPGHRQPMTQEPAPRFVQRQV